MNNKKNNTNFPIMVINKNDQTHNRKINDDCTLHCHQALQQRLTGWPLPSPRQIPRLFQVFPTETLVFVKPPKGTQRGPCVLPSEQCGTICSPSCACQLYLTVIRLNVHFVTIVIAVAHHNFTDFSLTNVKFLDFSRFFRRVATLTYKPVKQEN